MIKCNYMSCNILAINFNHDGSAVILSDGRIAAFLNTERFSKIKKHPGIRRVDLDHLLDQASLKLKEVNVVILCNLNNMDSPDIPFLYGTSLKESWLEFWINHTMNIVRIDGIEIPCIINPDHYLLHNALAYYTSAFDSAICFSWDPTGYGVHIGDKNKLSGKRYSIKGRNSCDLYTKAATELFGTGIIGAGKVMGLAPYGNPVDKESLAYDRMAEMHEICERYIYNKSGTRYPEALDKLFGDNPNHIYITENGKKLNSFLAYIVQYNMEKQLSIVLRGLFDIAREEGVEANICLGGGGALNSVANQVAFRSSGFERIHIHPASGDDGTAIGAALHHWFDTLGNERRAFTNREIMYSVRSYEDSIDASLSSSGYRDRFIVECTDEYLEKTACAIAEGKIVGWFQDGSEIGPRALGNRSILADPRDPQMKDILNRKVKFREGFRPFAPSVLNEFAEEWFGLKDSPFMLRVCEVLEPGVPSICHIDNTARVQTVSEGDNPGFYGLIRCFYEITGVPLLINTSFNIKGEPIVETPEDAINCFMDTELDVLVFNGKLLKKR
jgi:carbamoyltransferase